MTAAASAPAGSGTDTAPDARIIDRGWQRYEGARAGVRHAVASLLVHTLRHLLGLRRPARSKLLPVLAIVIAYVPAAVFVGVVALIDEAGDVLPGYADYYGFVISAILLFVTFVAPEALCPDRRSRVLSLYLASPLTRGTYLLAKCGAVATILLAVTLGPPLLFLLGRTIQGAGPDGILGFLGVLGRIVASGVVLAVVYTAVSMAVASLTERRAVAAAGVLLIVIGSAIVSGTLYFALEAPRGVLAFNLTRAPLDLVSHIYGEGGLAPTWIPWPILLSTLSLIVLGSTVVTVWRYESLQVTR